jgi:hypothetical protein
VIAAIEGSLAGACGYCVRMCNVHEKQIWETGGQAGEAVLPMKFDSHT